MSEIMNSGNRLRSVREKFGWDRTFVSRQTGITDITLRKWESSAAPLTKKGAIRCVSGYLKLGALVSAEWLLDGLGEGPKQISRGDYFALNPYSFELIRQMYDSESMFFSYVDQDEKFQIVNKKYESIFNLSADQVCGKKISEMIGSQGYKICKPFIDRALGGETVKFEYAWEFEKNKYRFLKLQYVPFINENSKVQGFFSYINDVEPHDSNAKQNSKLESILPILPKKKLEFSATTFKVALDNVCEQLKMYGLHASEDDILLLSKHIYRYSRLNPNEEVTQYLRRIIEIASRTNSLA